MNLYVGNLPYSVTENELNTAFAQFGEVGSAKIIMDRDSGQPKGFAFVEMANKAEATTAMNELNGSTMNEREIVVNEAKPRENRSGGSGGGNSNRR